jgi:hypothetical protein
MNCKRRESHPINTVGCLGWKRRDLHFSTPNFMPTKRESKSTWRRKTIRTTGSNSFSKKSSFKRWLIQMRWKESRKSKTWRSAWTMQTSTQVIEINRLSLKIKRPTWVSLTFTYSTSFLLRRYKPLWKWSIARHSTLSHLTGIRARRLLTMYLKLSWLELLARLEQLNSTFSYRRSNEVSLFNVK